MYDYDFVKKRKEVEEDLKNLLADNKKIYYFQLNQFQANKKENQDKENQNNEKQSNEEQNSDKQGYIYDEESYKFIKGKKTITKENKDKKYTTHFEFENSSKYEFKTFCDTSFGVINIDSSSIYKTFSNIKFNYCIFKDCVFKNIHFENCVFVGCEFIDCEFMNIKFSKCNFYDYRNKSTVYIKDSTLENIIFSRCYIRKCILEGSRINGMILKLSNLRRAIFIRSKIVMLTFCDCDLRNFSLVSSEVIKLDFEDELISKLNESTFFDKILIEPKKRIESKNNQYYYNIYKVYKNIESQYISNRLLNIAGVYHYLYKVNESKTLKGFSKIKSNVFWIICGYGERPTYALITCLEIVLIFAIIYMFTGLYVNSREINYIKYSPFTHTSRFIIVDFIYSLYFSLTTFTTVGYGDIIPSGFSIILSGIEMILGVTMVGIWTATFARKITR